MQKKQHGRYPRFGTDKKRLLSLAKYAKDAQPEILATLIQMIVERIYIVDKDDERFFYIFIKGCAGEDYTGFFQTADYIEPESDKIYDLEQCCIYDTLLKYLQSAKGLLLRYYPISCSFLSASSRITVS